MTKRTFYKTVIQVTVLSEEPFEYDSLAEINYHIMEGGCSGDLKTICTEELNGEQVASALISQGSDPEFFRVDSNGNDVDAKENFDDPPVSETMGLPPTFVVGQRLTPKHAMYLRRGDKVRWSDPNSGLCDREYRIDSIANALSSDGRGAVVVRITESDGSMLSCHPNELFWVAQD